MSQRGTKGAAVIGTLLLLMTLGWAAQSVAQTDSPPSIEPLIEAARKAGVEVIVLGQATEQAESAEKPLSERAAALASTFTNNAKDALRDLSDARETLREDITARSPDGTMSWPLISLLIAAFSLAVGWGIERLIAGRLRSRTGLSPLFEATSRSARIRRQLIRAVFGILLLIGSLALSLLIALAIADDAPHHRTVILSVLEAVALVRGFVLLADVTLAPHQAEERLLTLSDEAARAIFRRFFGGMAVAGTFAGFSFWLDRLPAAGGLVVLAGIVGTFVGGLTLSIAVAQLRQPIAQMLAGLAQVPSALQSRWHFIAILYFAAAFAASAFANIAGLDIGWIVSAPIFAAVLAAVVYATALLIVDIYFPEEVSADDQLPTFKGWAEQSGLAMALAAAALVILVAWGIGFFYDDGSVRVVYTVLLVSVMAYVGWSAIRTAFDRKIAEEQGLASPGEQSDEGIGQGGSRLATLLPLLRNALLIAISVLVAMIVLSAIGIDIVPLFAGAGLIGVAIGFGAQTLVRDIFSGVFFLIDDAFRVGEYIETGAAKGSVEKISIRSMQLRHHNGPLHTIPFGEITQLTNYSRDWVILKLPIRVQFGTDTERVRKLIKRLGVELLNHPEIGEKFIEPLKSQGVYGLDDLGIVTRLKFKTRPGDQFAVRRIVYQKIKEMFEREGIAFAGREVRVRVDGDPGTAEAAAGHPRVAAAAAEAFAENDSSMEKKGTT